ncbi:hypothetical protein JAAARDRAFT_133158 [Jaapia argillacea MUCL 33604]|uniref:ribonuclease H n=1 Tax=Jaapia argillacea MUCL 33604 TaxID=933084 RepID=A0A067PXR6_9AGAM|nr:hypothetical protein JAAARDRAFT_133158 [Jaapia argillacea MUCL 33604]
MLRTAKMFDVSFAPLAIDERLQKQLPAWFHIGVPPGTYNSATHKCIKDTHGTTTVATLLGLKRRLDDSRHKPRKDCKCQLCKDDHRVGCENPTVCCKRAAKILQKTPPKFNLTVRPLADGLTLTHHRKEKNRQAHQDRGDILFDPTVTVRASIAECFRIFTHPDSISNIPGYRLTEPVGGMNMLHEHLTVYTDGSCTNNGKANAQCGSGIWIEEGHPKNRSIRVPGNKQSNQVGEIVAVLVAAQIIEGFAPITFVTDSMYVIDGLTKHLPEWEDRGWIGVENSEFFKAAAYRLRTRSATTTFWWVKGHSGDQGNDAADRMAAAGAAKLIPDQLDLLVPKEFDLQGAKLATMTQAIAYQGIQSRSIPPTRPGARTRLEITRAALKELSPDGETDATIWKGCRNKDIRNPIQQFIYKTLHKTQKVGKYWLPIPNKQERARCSSCGAEDESMEHILTECQVEPAISTVWTLAKDLWPVSKGEWPEIHLGTILGAGSLTMRRRRSQPARDQDNRVEASPNWGASRLLRILISESAYLIWVIQCERVIQE